MIWNSFCVLFSFEWWCAGLFLLHGILWIEYINITHSFFFSYFIFASVVCLFVAWLKLHWILSDTASYFITKFKVSLSEDKINLYVPFDSIHFPVCYRTFSFHLSYYYILLLVMLYNCAFLCQRHIVSVLSKWIKLQPLSLYFQICLRSVSSVKLLQAFSRSKMSTILNNKNYKTLQNH